MDAVAAEEEVEEEEDKSARARAYLARVGIGTYIYDVLRLISIHGVGEPGAGGNSGGEDEEHEGGGRARLAFAAAYFASLATGNHVFRRSYSFITSTAFNMTCFAVRYEDILAGVNDSTRAGVPLSCTLCRSTARLVCPDFPAHIVRIAWRIMLMVRDGEPAASDFARAVHAVMRHDGLVRGCRLDDESEERDAGGRGREVRQRSITAAMLTECAIVELGMDLDEAKKMAQEAVDGASYPCSSPSPASSSSSASSSSADETSSGGLGGDRDDESSSVNEVILACFIQRRIDAEKEGAWRCGDDVGLCPHLDYMDAVSAQIHSSTSKLSLPSSPTSIRKGEPRQKKKGASSAASASTSVPTRSKSARATAKLSAAVRGGGSEAADGGARRQQQ